MYIITAVVPRSDSRLYHRPNLHAKTTLLLISWHHKSFHYSLKIVGHETHGLQLMIEQAMGARGNNYWSKKCQKICPDSEICNLQFGSCKSQNGACGGRGASIFIQHAWYARAVSNLVGEPSIQRNSRFETMHGNQAEFRVVPGFRTVDKNSI